jgi:hypothetical protein
MRADFEGDGFILRTQHIMVASLQVEVRFDNPDLNTPKHILRFVVRWIKYLNTLE